MNDFINEDSKSLENRLLRVIKQNTKGIGASFVVYEYGRDEPNWR
jgi:hypothetical protein